MIQDGHKDEVGMHEGKAIRICLIDTRTAFADNVADNVGMP